MSAVLYGSQSTFASGEPGEIERAVVSEDGAEPRDFLIPDMPRISSKGTRREILAPIRSLEAGVDGSNLRVSVELTRGAYATCLLREYMKADLTSPEAVGT